jgi:long-chain acyl-CoA synthetase
MKYKNLFSIWRESAERYPEQIALSDEKSNISFLESYREICFLADIFKGGGIFAENFAHWLLIEQAIICLGAVSVAKNSQNNIQELDYVFNNSETVALISDKTEIIDFFSEQNKNLKMILYIGDDKKYKSNGKISYFYDLLNNFDAQLDYFSDYQNNPDDICYIHYTSGTSSAPKGSILVNYGMSYQVEEIQKFLKTTFPKLFIATFSLASAGGKCFQLYAISMGCQIVYTPYKNFFDKVNHLHPDLLHCAPKIMLTMYGKYMEYIKSKGFLFNLFFNFNYNLSLKLIELQRKLYSKRETNISATGICGLFENILSRVRYFQYYFFYKKIKNFLLDDNIVIAVGSASLAKQIEDFCNVIGIDITQHYGMTETTGLTTHTTVQDQKERPYSVGKFFSKTKFKIIDVDTKEELPPNKEGILLIKGPEVLKGYYNNISATEKTLSNDGWLITGDLAYYTDDNYIYILSRYDDVIVMMNGYNVYAPLLQDQINSSLYVKQSVVVGQGKPYLSGLIVPDLDAYKKWCLSNHSICYENLNEDNKFKEYLISELNILISKKICYHYFEKLKKIYFLKDEFSVENGFLTNTLKIKYRKICRTYDSIINQLYR